jgi:hypothetical protein
VIDCKQIFSARSNHAILSAINTFNILATNPCSSRYETVCVASSPFLAFKLIDTVNFHPTSAVKSILSILARA